MMQNVLLTSLTPLKNKNEISCWENRPFTTVWPEITQQMKTDITRTIKKKQKRVRTAFSPYQLLALEKAYSCQKYIDSKKRAELANTLNIGNKCIKVWFQNRRMKDKIKMKASSDTSYDSSTESTSIKSPAVPATSPLQVTIDEPTAEPLDKFSHYTDNSYQLPTYYNTNPVQSSYGAVAPPSFTTYFHNENNIYPTQYYPYDVNYSNGEGDRYNQYSSETNNNWTENQYLDCLDCFLNENFKNK